MEWCSPPKNVSTLGCSGLAERQAALFARVLFARGEKTATEFRSNICSALEVSFPVNARLKKPYALTEHQSLSLSFMTKHHLYHDTSHSSNYAD